MAMKIRLGELTGSDPRPCSADTGAKLVDRLTEVGARLGRHLAASAAW